MTDTNQEPHVGDEHLDEEGLRKVFEKQKEKDKDLLQERVKAC